MTDHSIPAWLRWRPPTPAPRDVPISAEQHCPASCEHLRQAWQRGYTEGRRDERERREGSVALKVLLGILGGMLAAGLVRWGAWWVGGR